MQEEEVKNILAPTSNIVRADEIKLAVVAVQQHNKAKSPFFVLAAQPQTIILVSNFNNVVTAACMAACEELCNTWLVSVAADGVGCDNKWVCLQLVGFLEGKHRHVRIVDTNHNGKNF
jgi:hypothetical protein